MHMITSRVSVGNREDAREIPPTFSALLLVAEEFEVQPAPWIEYAKIPLTEYAAANVDAVARAVEWIERRIETNRILVCCRAGMGRSVSMVLAYLCCVEGMTYADAERLVKARRPGASPLPDIERVIESVQERRRTRTCRPPS
ncbi:protein-tyrosine-phosphatase [Nitrospira sp.]|nr:protein-tyrosine-phosphatase [Nitrospira sp.]